MKKKNQKASDETTITGLSGTVTNKQVSDVIMDLCIRKAELFDRFEAIADATKAECHALDAEFKRIMALPTTD